MFSVKVELLFKCYTYENLIKVFEANGAPKIQRKPFLLGIMKLI